MFGQIIVFGAVLLILSICAMCIPHERAKEVSNGLLRVALIAVLLGVIGSVMA